MRFWDSLREMERMRREIDRVFHDAGFGPFGLPTFRSAFLPGTETRGYPLLKISEDAENVYVAALAPGLSTDSISLSVVGDQLTLSGEKPGLGDDVKPEAYHRSERAAGRFTRTLTLPVAVDDAKSQAEYRNGILAITLPKSEAAKPKQISVKVS